MAALDGIRVIELGQVIAGTYGTQFLADYGAEVLKVEPPWGDLGRNPATGDLGGMSSLFASMNRNKRSVVLDLRVAAARDALLDLVRTADVVIENFRPGTLDRLGIGEGVLRAANPRLVFASVTGFGRDGADADLPSFDLVHQAMSGWMSVIGEPDRPPASVPMPLADLLAGFYLSHGVLAALVERARTGEGRTVETTMLDVLTSLLTYQGTMVLNTGLVPERRGSHHEFHVPWQAYETADGYLVVAPREERFWRLFCEAIGEPGLPDDPRFADAASRRANRAELEPRLEARMRERPASEWLAAFRATGVPAAPVRDMAEALADPALADRGMVLTLAPTGVTPPIRVMGNPLRFDGAIPGPVASPVPPPGLGEHTIEILRDVLGYGSARIEALADSGALGSVRPDRAPLDASSSPSGGAYP